MNDPLQLLLQQSGIKRPSFTPNSRYFGIDTATVENTEGQSIIYVRRRFIAPPEKFDLLQEHTVTEGERPDQVAQQYLSDPEQFWRICDANAVMNPNELTDTIGRKIRITLPEGIPGNNNA